MLCAKNIQFRNNSVLMLARVSIEIRRIKVYRNLKMKCIYANHRMNCLASGMDWIGHCFMPYSMLLPLLPLANTV
uniref:Uncharacterized protein n=1 Tax=Anguilla anguilla TaxID=7936 RepID=A0A0E9X1V9_ANGAN